ncbi:hypothetical protein [Motilimonas pumila]|uniref:Uncharacterized protein n=1 Tax=Motilimonas pumila TaxID=2303987 RepID=A0A418YJP5_9GAMM|nr:hypothetical protein [Motilimonas pumila]RJG50704.1 hypothetical protein D1Z90_04305 [Motilimonas pumila]
MKTLIKWTLSTLLLCSAVVKADEGSPELGKYPKVYQTQDYQVTILRIGSKEAQTYLVKVDGLDNDFDGQIYKHHTLCDNTSCKKYKLETKEIPGTQRWWTIQTTQSWGGNTGLVMYPPGIEEKQYLYKAERPKSFEPAAFYQTYLGQITQR